MGAGIGTPSEQTSASSLLDLSYFQNFSEAASATGSPLYTRVEVPAANFGLQGAHAALLEPIMS